MHGPSKYKPWKGCNCFQCRHSGQRVNKFYKQVETHQRFRRESKKRIKEGDFGDFTIGTGYRA